MAIELNVNGLSAQTLTMQDAAAGTQTGKTEISSKVLTGESLKVVSGAMSDLEALVEKLKNESEDAKQSVAQRRAAILDTVLTTMSDKVSEEQRENLLKLEELKGKLDEANADKAAYETEKSAAAARSAVLDAQIKALENAVENQIELGEDHRKQVEKLKAQKAEEDAKIADLTNKISSLETKIAGFKSSIASCEESIGAATLNIVAEAIREMGAEITTPEKAETQAEKDKEAAKAEANDISAQISRGLDKIAAEIERTVEREKTVMV